MTGRSIGDRLETAFRHLAELAVDATRTLEERVERLGRRAEVLAPVAPTRLRRIIPAVARMRAVPLMAPRLACKGIGDLGAVCSGGSQMRSQPHIRPAIGVMP